jgi:nucleoid-associated protein YgaU
METVQRKARKSNLYPQSRYKRVEEISVSPSLPGVFYLDLPGYPAIEKSSSDQYYTVTSETENRLDKISYSFYRTIELWWVIAHANNIINPFVVPVGTTLRIPQIGNLYSVGGILV